MHSGEQSLLNKRYWENWAATWKRTKLEHFLTPNTKISSKWIKDLNVRLETTKLTQEKLGRMLCDIKLKRYLFLDLSSKTKETKAKIHDI